MLATCFSTTPPVTTSAVPIPALDRPSAISASTSRSLGVSLARPTAWRLARTSWLTTSGSSAVLSAVRIDPLFDPLECTGHPGDTETAPEVWYFKQAQPDSAVSHPLWRVRASVVSARGRIPFIVARTLSRDPRPEVRRTVAALDGPLDVLRALKRDSDVQVASIAAFSWPNGLLAARKRRPIWVVRGVLALLPLAAGLSYSLIPDGQTGTALSAGSARPGTTLTVPKLSGSGITPTGTTMLPGGGVMTCGMITGSGQVFVAVFAGGSKLTLRITGGHMLPGDQAVAEPVIVQPGQHIVVWYPHAPARVSLKADPGSSQPGTWIAVAGCGS